MIESGKMREAASAGFSPSQTTTWAFGLDSILLRLYSGRSAGQCAKRNPPSTNQHSGRICFSELPSSTTFHRQTQTLAQMARLEDVRAPSIVLRARAGERTLL